jgi:hypothetical protein
MAIDLGSIAKSAVVGLLGKNLRRVAGNVGSVLRGGATKNDSSDFGIIRTKLSTKMLSFPIDVANADRASGNHGHYIMFEINEQIGSKLNWGSRAAEKVSGELEALKEDSKRKLKAATENQIVEDVKSSHIDYKKAFAKTSKELKKIGVGGIAGTSRTNYKSTVYIDRPPTKKLDTVITLFMPPGIKTNYKANYTDTSIGSATKVGVGLYTDIMSGKNLKGVTDNLQTNTGELGQAMAIDAALQLVSSVPSLGGLKEATEMQMGEILADRMELAFKGIDKRSFEYTFKMLPRSEVEADEIVKIIGMFKHHMLPEMKGAHTRGRRMSIPSTFDIKYMFVNTENQYLNKVSTCFLESMDVSYADGKFKAHEGGQPVETTITLSFKEIELITRDKLAEGF